MNELYGIDKLENIIFHAKNVDVSKQAIIFLGGVLSTSEDIELCIKYKEQLIKKSLQFLTVPSDNSSLSRYLSIIS